VSVRIPLLRVAGSHREVGRAVGAATAPVLRDAVAFDAALPAGRSRGEQLALAARYRAATRAATPWLVEEIDGAAEGAGVDPVALFAASVEEIWTVRPSQAGTAEPVPGRCSDLVIGPPFTADGHLRVAHNNDLGEESEPQVVAVEWRVPGEPVVFSLGIGPWISVGWNAAGLSLTGNELTPNDERVGVPRLLMVREQLTATTLDEAVAMALRPDRASSYNTVLAHRDGRSANVEGSGGDAVVRYVGAGETLAHTNHYVEPAMLRYEGDPAYARRSAVRYERACALLAAAAAAPPGTVTSDVLRGWLSDHPGAPDSLCRHPGGGPVGGGPGGDGRGADPGEAAGGGDVAEAAAESRVKTVFWAVADVSAGTVLYGRGNPCAGHEPERHAFR
jgi:isopenicillin-N N-acyltransferase-like protein